MAWFLVIFGFSDGVYQDQSKKKKSFIVLNTVNQQSRYKKSECKKTLPAFAGNNFIKNGFYSCKKTQVR